MIQKHNIAVLFTLLLVISFTSGCRNNIENINKDQLKAKAVEPQKNESDKNSTKQKGTESNNADNSRTSENDKVPNDTDQNKTDFNKQNFIRKSSGIVTTVPWENDIDFKEVQEKSGTYVMMAAYCTVLPDPLPGEEENVHIGAKMLKGIVVEPDEVFSQNKTIGPYTQARGYKNGPTYSGSCIITTIGGGVCKIATTLYNVAVMSNLEIVERHAHGMPVSYTPYGQDATVSYGTYDFKFKNNTGSPILIWTHTIDNVLYIGFYGRVKPPRVQWHHEILDIKKTKKIYNVNAKLAPGTNKLVIIGADGAKVKSWATVAQADGSIITKQLGTSVYLPLPYIYEKGV